MHRRFMIDEDYKFVPQKCTRVNSLIPMPDNPKISIVMNSFNQGNYICEAIESILYQDYENVELLVVDGVSTDGTIEIVEEFTRQDPRVRLLNEEDSSPLEAIHKGLRMATGHILATQTSSDYYCPSIFRQVVREFRQNSKLFAVGGG